MANYYSSCRSNYFKIGRPKEFMEWIEQIPGVVFKTKEKQSEPEDLIGMVYVDDPDGGSWPNYVWDDDENEMEIDFIGEIAEFLAPGEVAIFMEVGAEKLRYLCGQAIAINSKGESIEVNINDIYQKVSEKWGIDYISTAEY